MGVEFSLTTFPLTPLLSISISTLKLMSKIMLFLILSMHVLFVDLVNGALDVVDVDLLADAACRK